MDSEKLLDALRELAARVMGSARMLAGTSADTPLGEGGLWLDSMGLLELIVACEVEFGITFEPGEDLVGHELDTLGTLAKVIERRSPRLSSTR